MAKAATPKVEHITRAPALADAGGAARRDAQLRANLAAYHIQAAAVLARQAHRIESENAERAFDKECNPIFWSVSASVIMAWAALEANINHLVKTFEDENAHNVGLVERCAFLYREPVAAKYEGLAKLKECELKETSNIFISFAALGDFRDALADFQPEWHDEEGRHAELCQEMREILKPVVGMPADAIFPFCHLSYECAKWAVVTATGVSAHYATLIGAKDQLAASWLDLELP
ncbi:hypothetical protein RZS28_03745 [Methylocapsa polymorpha]|uniref:Uncharacterized protein n=1 Tax=Methylocapsa polymorpha TaxID=3080828 RepID=A0ABZ0HV39_9HYPH|nr:hypothetical protein RZS28_03745 [Methylocapsa sp. RX1]